MIAMGIIACGRPFILPAIWPMNPAKKHIPIIEAAGIVNLLSAYLLAFILSHGMCFIALALLMQISAKKGTGVDELLDTVLLLAELQELLANPDRNARGTVIESHMDKKKGAVATMLVAAGTLRTGDIVQAGATYGKVVLSALASSLHQHIYAVLSRTNMTNFFGTCDGFYCGDLPYGDTCRRGATDCVAALE